MVVNGTTNGTAPSGDVEDTPFGYFSAGPSKLPDEVMKKAQRDFISYGNSRVGVMELSHRSPEYLAINDEALSGVRRIFNVPNNYKVIFLQGGGTGQFAAVPLNFLPEGSSADYCVTGTWSDKSYKEAKRFANVKSVCPMKKFTCVPDESTWSRDPNASYMYYCDNETVHGIEFGFIPSNEGQFANVPVVADMSSNFGTRIFDVNRFGAVFAAAQKNVGPAGCTIAFVRDDLIGKARPYCPTILDYQIMAKNDSLYNTPVTFSIYMTKLVMDWIEENGGLAQMEENSKKKSQLLYDIIDGSNGFYTTEIPQNSRSRCNVVFRLKNGDEALESEFLSAAKKNNLLALKGHRSVGGVRASIYNAISLPMVQKLASFMQEFQSNHNL